MFGDAQAGLPGDVGEAGGDVQQSVTELLGFGGGERAVQEELLRPGEQVDADQGEL